MSGPPLFIRTTLLAFTLVLAACGGGGSSDGESGARTGLFIDSAVLGLEYQSLSYTGITDARGQFQFVPGEDITFSIGGIVLGTVAGQSIVTPVNLVTDAVSADNPTVLNIARLLQTLDNNGDPSDGIEITPAVRSAAAPLTGVNFQQSLDDFANDGDVVNLIADLTTLTTAGPRNLLSAPAALTHLRDSLFDLLGDGDYRATIDVSGDETTITGTRLSVDDIVYGLEEFTTTSNSLVLAGRGLSSDSLLDDDTEHESGFYLVLVDATAAVGSALVVYVDGTEYTYSCTVNCAIQLDYDTRSVTLTDALFVNNDNASQLTLNGFVEWLESDEIEDNDGGSGPTPPANGSVCTAPHTTTIASLTANNAYRFAATTDNCYGLQSANTERMQVPLSVAGAIGGLSFDANAKLARTNRAIDVGNATYRFIDWYLVFEVHNNSGELVCGRLEDIELLDANDNIITDLNVTEEGNLYIQPFFSFGGYDDDCITPGESLILTATGTGNVGTDPFPDFDLVVSARTSSRMEVPSNAAQLVAAESLEANSLEWKYFSGNIGLEASFTNSSDTTIELQDNTMKVHFYDADGYFVSRDYVNLYDALGIDESELEAEHYLVAPGETFTLADDVADIGYVNLSPASATSAIVYLDWKYAADD